MEMFLMLSAMTVLAIAVTCILFAASMRTESENAEVRAETTIALAPPRFFVQDSARAAMPAVPIEALLLQIERHVRLEQAAAESFLDAPTPKSLHSRTTSPLVH